MNKNEIKNIILEEIKAAINEQTEDARIAQAMETGDEDELESLAMGALDRAEQLAADSRPEEDDFAFDKMDGEMYDDGGDPMLKKKSYLKWPVHLMYLNLKMALV
jgi:hypothetical protein